MNDHAKKILPKRPDTTSYISHTHRISQWCEYGDAVERLFEDAVEVTGLKISTNNTWAMSENKSRVDTHRALLIGVQPTEQEKNMSAADVLRQLAGYCGRNYPLMSHPDDEKYRCDLAKRGYELADELERCEIVDDGGVE